MENVLYLPSREVMCTFFDVALSYITLRLNPCLLSCSFWLMTSSDMEMYTFPFKGAPYVSVLEDKGFSYWRNTLVWSAAQTKYRNNFGTIY